MGVREPEITATDGGLEPLRLGDGACSARCRVADGAVRGPGAGGLCFLDDGVCGRTRRLPVARAHRSRPQRDSTSPDWTGWRATFQPDSSQRPRLPPSRWIGNCYRQSAPWCPMDSRSPLIRLDVARCSSPSTVWWVRTSITFEVTNGTSGRLRSVQISPVTVPAEIPAMGCERFTYAVDEDEHPMTGTVNRLTPPSHRRAQRRLR